MIQAARGARERDDGPPAPVEDPAQADALRRIGRRVSLRTVVATVLLTAATFLLP